MNRNGERIDWVSLKVRKDEGKRKEREIERERERVSMCACMYTEKLGYSVYGGKR